MTDPLAERVTLRQVDRLPAKTWDIPSDEMHAKLGCAGCYHAVYFVAEGINNLLPQYSIAPEASGDIRDLLGEVDKQTVMFRGLTSEDNTPCERLYEDGICPNVEMIDLVAELLNDRFEADLTPP